MLKESVFYKFLNRSNDVDFDQYLRESVEDVDYIDWNGFVLRKDYGNAELEYNAIRNGCALFDETPVPKYQIRGMQAGILLDHLLTRPVSSVPSMQGMYVAYCNEDGSLKDDSVLYKYAEDDYLIFPSDIDHIAYFESLRSKLRIPKLPINELSIIDCSDRFAGMAIQGPMSATVLKQMGFKDIEYMEPFQIKNYQLENDPDNTVVRVIRWGFTADLGYECWMPTNLSKLFEQSISAAGSELGLSLPGYGLTAMEACRIEGGLIVSGWDCATEADPQAGFERSPFELDIDSLVNLDAGDFIGRDALIEEKLKGGRFVRRSFSADVRAELEDGAPIWASIDGDIIPIGSVSCSSWSWGLKKRIGHATIMREFKDVHEAEIKIDNKRQMITLSRGPLRKLDRENEVPAKIFT